MANSDKATSKVFARTDILTKLDAAEKALAGEKARIDIAERRSIAAGEQAEELQEQVIDLTAALTKAEARIEKLRVLTRCRGGWGAQWTCITLDKHQGVHPSKWCEPCLVLLADAASK